MISSNFTKTLWPGVQKWYDAEYLGHEKYLGIKRIYRDLDIRFSDYDRYLEFCKRYNYYPVDFKEEWIPVFKTLIRLQDGS